MRTFQLLSLAVCSLSPMPLLAQVTHPSPDGLGHVHPGEGTHVHLDSMAQEVPTKGRPVAHSHGDAAELPSPRTEISVEGNYRIIRTNGIPNHPTGNFPNARNPNAIQARDDELTVPLNPTRLDRPMPAHGAFGVAINGVPFDAGTAEYWTPEGRRRRGGANRPEGQVRSEARQRPEGRRPDGQRPQGQRPSGQRLKGQRPESQRRPGGPARPSGQDRPEGPRSRGQRSEWNYEALGGTLDLGIDLTNAHVQPPGKYHYHGQPNELIKTLPHGHSEGGPLLVGWAADGFPIYVAGEDQESDQAWTSSYRLKTGSRPSSPDGPGGIYDGTFTADWEYQSGLGTLDECNGRTGVTDEFPEGTYFYVVTDEYPFVPRFWRGQPDPSFGRPRDARGPATDGDRRRR